jgi:hypothetical protein
MLNMYVISTQLVLELLNYYSKPVQQTDWPLVINFSVL